MTTDRPRHCLPMIKSPSQFPGTARSSTSGGRSAILIMFGMRFLRYPTLRLGREDRCEGRLILPRDGLAQGPRSRRDQAMGPALAWLRVRCWS